MWVRFLETKMKFFSGGYGFGKFPYYSIYGGPYYSGGGYGYGRLGYGYDKQK